MSHRKITLTQKKSVSIEKEMIQAIKLISNGASVKEVSQLLKMNNRTIESKISGLRYVFGCSTTTQLACEFIREKIIK